MAARDLETTAPWSDGDGPADGGDKLGRFVVLGPLGRGGTGIVLAAYDPDLDRKVALKLLHDVTAPDARERLLREARAMAKLSHPNVLAVHEVGTVGGRAFIAMKYAGGGTLRAWCAAAPRSWREILDMYLAAGRGLAAAHAAGFIHRDFKPENALVTDGDVVCVADFGLVSVRALTSGDDAAANPRPDDGPATLTRTGAVMGTPAYMAPEQHAGGEVAAAADQFAYCVALWEALYGVRPVTGATARELAASVRDAATATPPADRDVPAWLCDVLRRGLHTDPGERWPAMDALLDALSRDPDAEARALAATRRRRRTLLATALAGVVVAGAAATIAVVSRSSSEVEACDAGVDRFAGVWDPAVRADLASRAQALGKPFAARAFDAIAGRVDRRRADWQAMRLDACQATRVRKEQSDSALDLRTACLDRRFDELAGFIGLLRAPTPELLDRAAARDVDAGDVADCADATVLARRRPLPDGDSRAQVVELERALAADRAAVETERKLDPAIVAQRVELARSLAYPPATATALYVAGVDARNRTAFADARGLFEQALPLADAGGDDVLRFQIAEKLTDVAGSQLEQFADGLRYGELAKGVLARLPAEPLREAGLLSTLANVYWRKGELPRARELADQAVAIGRRVDPDSLETADYLYTLAMVRNDSDDPRGAIETVDRSAAIIEAKLGTAYPSYGRCLNVRGAAERRLGKHADAEKDFDRALDIFRASRGEDCIEVAIVHTNLGSLLDSRKDFAGAIAEQRLAAGVFTRMLGADSTRALNTEQRLGDSLSKSKHYDEAESILRDTTARLERSLGPSHPYVANGYYYLGQHDRRIAKLDDAIVQFRASERAWIGAQGAESKNLTRVYSALGDTYDDLHREPEAIASYEAALARIGDDATGGGMRARLELALADVLVRGTPTAAATGQARGLALRAHGDLVAEGETGKADLVEVEAWLAKHFPQGR